MSTPQKKPSSSSARRVAEHRKRMRDAGLVARTIWVPDTRNPEFLAQLEREARVIAGSEEERSVLAWCEDMQAGLDLGPIPAYRLPAEK
jgi:hypothetical protein